MSEAVGGSAVVVGDMLRGQGLGVDAVVVVVVDC